MNIMFAFFRGKVRVPRRRRSRATSSSSKRTSSKSSNLVSARTTRRAKRPCERYMGFAKNLKVFPWPPLGVALSINEYSLSLIQLANYYQISPADFEIFNLLAHFVERVHEKKVIITCRLPYTYPILTMTYSQNCIF